MTTSTTYTEKNIFQKLVIACLYGHKDVIELIISNGADVKPSQ